MTLSSDWEVSASTNLFRSGAGGWADHACATLPTEGQNMLVSTDGINCHWDTYVPLVTPSVSFTSLGSTIAVNQDVKFSATSENINGAGNPASSYKFYVNNVEVSGEHYQFDAIGNYTIKVEAYDSSNDKQAEAEQNGEVISGAHVIYFVKNNAWPRVHAHMWDEAVEHMTTWPGDEMTLTNAETDRNHYAVYAVAFTINYDHIILTITVKPKQLIWILILTNPITSMVSGLLPWLSVTNRFLLPISILQVRSTVGALPQTAL